MLQLPSIFVNQRKELTPLIHLFKSLFLLDTIDRRLITFERKICRQIPSPDLAIQCFSPFNNMIAIVQDRVDLLILQKAESRFWIIRK